MAAMSAIATAPTLTPPSSSHGTSNPWEISSSGEIEDSTANNKLPQSNDGENERTAVPLQNGNHLPLGYRANGSSGGPSRKLNGGGDTALDPKARNHDAGYLSPPYTKDAKPRGIRDDNSPADSLVDLYGSNKSASEGDPQKRSVNELYENGHTEEDSKWIHRDKLARIESEELQAAGIILPRAPRAPSKPQSRTRRDQSQDKANGRAKTATGSVDQTTPRSRKNSETTVDPHTPLTSSVPSFDLRLPEEIAAEANGYFSSNGGVKGVSRIPVAKLSPVPIPAEHLERGTPMVRKREGSPGEEESINYPKPRSRSGSLANTLGSSTNLPAAQPAKRLASEGSPKKSTTARKTSGPGKAGNGTTSRPRTRGGPSKDSTGSGATTTRPSTRGGERDFSSASTKQPEGDPPWLVSAYRPDPRLPPDQQLLPTVAKRLQQEKWEREGKFGSVYDKEFRPLNDEGFQNPPPAPAEAEPKEEEKKAEDWPLRPEPANSPQPLGRTGSYTTMPKINDKPNFSPLPSPRPPMSQQAQQAPVIRTQDAPEDSPKEKGGCGCCIVM